jgi:hypothetical protein
VSGIKTLFTRGFEIAAGQKLLSYRTDVPAAKMGRLVASSTIKEDGAAGGNGRSLRDK